MYACLNRSTVIAVTSLPVVIGKRKHFSNKTGLRWGGVRPPPQRQDAWFVGAVWRRWYAVIVIVVLLVCLKDSVLAFHEHGMQGKSFKKTQVTQEILDGQRTYKLVGADRWDLPLCLPFSAAELTLCICYLNEYKKNWDICTQVRLSTPENGVVKNWHFIVSSPVRWRLYHWSYVLDYCNGCHMRDTCDIHKI